MVQEGAVRVVGWEITPMGWPFQFDAPVRGRRAAAQENGLAIVEQKQREAFRIRKKPFRTLKKVYLLPNFFGEIR